MRGECARGFFIQYLLYDTVGKSLVDLKTSLSANHAPQTPTNTAFFECVKLVMTNTPSTNYEGFLAFKKILEIFLLLQNLFLFFQIYIYQIKWKSRIIILKC